MRRFLLTTALTAAVGLGAAASAVQAQSPYNYFGPYQGGYRHDAEDRFHDHLDRREHRRQWIDREAHRYPMPPWQHERLHDRLDQERYRDAVRDREFHRRYDRHDYHDHDYDHHHHGPHHPGFQRPGIYVDPDHGVDINTGRFRFHFGR